MLPCDSETFEHKVMLQLMMGAHTNVNIHTVTSWPKHDETSQTSSDFNTTNIAIP